MFLPHLNPQNAILSSERKFKELLVNELSLVNFPPILAENLAFTYWCGEREEHKGKVHVL